MRRLLPVILLFSALGILSVVVGCDSPPPTVAARPGKSTNDEVLTNPTRGGVQAPVAPRQVLLPGARTRVLSAAGDRDFDKTFDDLRFEMQVGEPFRRELLTEAIKGLDGKPIRIRGFILPTAQKRGLKQFVLVRDNQECCFGPGAALFDCILVEMQAGKTAEFSIRPVAVSGKFQIREFQGPDGVHLAIYQIEGESVE